MKSEISVVADFEAGLQRLVHYAAQNPTKVRFTVAELARESGRSRSLLYGPECQGIISRLRDCKSRADQQNLKQTKRPLRDYEKRDAEQRREIEKLRSDQIKLISQGAALLRRAQVAEAEVIALREQAANLRNAASQDSSARLRLVD